MVKTSEKSGTIETSTRDLNPLSREWPGVTHDAT